MDEMIFVNYFVQNKMQRLIGRIVFFPKSIWLIKKNDQGQNQTCVRANYQYEVCIKSRETVIVLLSKEAT